MTEIEATQADIIASIQPSTARRRFALVVLYTLGLLMIYLAFVRPPEHLIWQAFLLALGFGAIWLAEKLRRATLIGLIFSQDGLTDTQGRVLARFDDIRAVDRGFFAFKPSNGFMLRLAKGQPLAWAPGMWWRIGRRIGVGGATSASQTKAMAEAIAFVLADRDAN